MVVKLIALILPLGLDTVAVAAALGAGGATAGQRRRISLLFTLFEAAMPLVGLALGVPLGRAIGRAADYVAIGVLFVFGLYTMLGNERDEDEQVAQLLDARGPRALALGVSISLDELAIGFTLGLLRVPVVLVVVLIALQAFVVSQLGMRLGQRLSERFREGAERLAGLALTGLAIGLLVEKVT